MTLYAIIYGPDYEDIKYFSDIDKAKKSLILYTLNKLFNHDTIYYALLYQYEDNDGIYLKSDIEYFIEFDKLDSLCISHNYSYNDIKKNPELVSHLIETC